MSENKFVIPLIINATIFLLLFCQHFILEAPNPKIDQAKVEKKWSLERPAQQSVPENSETQLPKLRVSGINFPQPPSLNAPLRRDKLATINENRPTKVSHSPFKNEAPNKPELNALKIKKHYSGLIPMSARQLKKEENFRSVALLESALVPKIVEARDTERLKSVSKPTLTKTKHIMPRPRFEDTKENVLEVSIEKTDLLNGIKVLAAVERERNLNMEIFWPADLDQAELLFDILQNCFGMRNAVLDQNGQLYDEGGKIGTSSRKLSPFLRQIEETVSAKENQNISRIRRRNIINEDQILLRVMSFKTDAKIMDGISKLYGADLMQTKSIKADYVMERKEVYIDGIVIDGKKIYGRIKLTGRKCTI